MTGVTETLSHIGNTQSGAMTTVVLGMLGSDVMKSGVIGTGPADGNMM